MGLYERIKKLATEKKMSIRSVEEALGYGNGTIRRWDNQTPGVDKIQKVADFFNVSTDYLLGRIESTQSSNFLSVTVSQNIKKLRAKNNETLADIASSTSIPIKQLENIENMNEIASTEILKRLGRHFDVEYTFFTNSMVSEVVEDELERAKEILEDIEFASLENEIVAYIKMKVSLMQKEKA